MKKIRIGNDFVFSWAIERGGVPEALETVLEKHMHMIVNGTKTEITDYIVLGNNVIVEFTSEMLKDTGTYTLLFNYILPDASLSDNERKCTVDVDAFKIVPKTSMADDTSEFSVTSDMAIAFKGDKGDSAYNFPTLQFDFEEERPNSIDEIFPDSYTPINEDSIFKKLELPLPKPSSPKEKFYQAIVNAEMQRVKLAIIDYAPKQRSDIDTREMITSTLKNILHFAKQDSLDNEPITATLRIQLVCFYVELVAIASPLLTQDKNYLSFDDLMFEVFQHYPQENEVTAYQTFVSSQTTFRRISYRRP